MNILAALKQEEAKLQKQVDKVRQQLDACIFLNCEVAVPSSGLATVPKVPAQRYRGTIRYHRFAQYPSPSSV